METLSFTDHPNRTKEYIAHLLESSQFSDVTLFTDDGKLVKSHKFILSLYSNVFRNIFQQSDLNVLFLRKIHEQDLRTLLNYLYKGEALIAKERLNDFIQLANELQIQGVTKNETKNCSENINEDLYNIGDDIVFRKMSSIDASTKINKNKDIITQQNTNDKELYSEDDYGFDDQVIEDVDDLIEYCKGQSEDQDYDQSKIEEKDKMFDTNHIVLNHSFNDNDAKEKDTIVKENILSINDTWDLSSKTIREFLSEEDVRNFKCTPCQKQYRHITGLVNHVSVVHRKIRFSCDECDYKTTNKKCVMRHKMSQHRGLKDQCPQCYGFFAKSSLSTHIKAIHKKEIFHCDQCDFNTRSRTLLQNHTDYYHEGIVNFKCEKCDYSSYRKYNVDIHRKNMH